MLYFKHISTAQQFRLGFDSTKHSISFSFQSKAVNSCIKLLFYNNDIGDFLQALSIFHCELESNIT